jgi:hypothetical protein
MGQLSAAALDLFTKIVAIPALATSTGLAIGGKEPDPGMTKIPLPAAWILLAQFDNENLGSLTNRPPTVANVRAQYGVFLYLPYKSQADLIANQLPLVEQVVQAVQGTPIANTGASQRWALASGKLAGVNTDRVIYHLAYELFTPLV